MMIAPAFALALTTLGSATIGTPDVVLAKGERNVIKNPAYLTAVNACLIEIGKEPLPQKLKGMNAVMTSKEAEAFSTCLKHKNF